MKKPKHKVHLNTGKGTNIFAGQKKKDPPPAPLCVSDPILSHEDEIKLKNELKETKPSENDLLEKMTGQKPTKTSEQKDFSGFTVGAKINYIKYGDGTIVKRTENNVTIYFPSLSKKITFILKYCNNIFLI